MHDKPYLAIAWGEMITDIQLSLAVIRVKTSSLYVNMVFDTEDINEKSVLFYN